jgi:hypothetical protein
VNATFSFAPTIGRFYFAWDGATDGRVCHLNNLPLVTVSGTTADFPFFYSNDSERSAGQVDEGQFGIPLPAGQPDPVTVFDVQVPQQSISCPITVTAPVGNPPATPTLSSNGQCVVGTPHSITMSATDPADDGLRYAVDWDANGVVDQYVPGFGFVPSGSTQTATRTYAISGSKTVKVLARDSNGLTSGWASISYNCAGSTTTGLNENGNGGTDESGGGGTGQPLPDLDLRVIPSLVRSGDTTKVNWSSVNVQSCTVSGENGDAWSGLLSALGGNISKPITGETTYTLSCLALDGSRLTKSTTVRIIPTFQEI